MSKAGYCASWGRRSSSRSRATTPITNGNHPNDFIDEDDDIEPEPQGYLENAESHLLNEFISMVNERDWKDARIMDVGCGTGQTTVMIAHRLRNKSARIRDVTGVDDDIDAVDYALITLADELTYNFSWVTSFDDYDTFDPHWKGFFDWVFVSHLLVWTQQQQVVLENLKRCIKSGGSCFVAVPASKPPDLHAALNKVIKSNTWSSYFTGVSETVTDLIDPDFNKRWFNHHQADRIYAAQLEYVGFRILKTRLDEFTYVFHSDDEYKEFLKSFFTPISAIPPQKQPALWKDFFKAALKKVKRINGKIRWKVKYAIVIAKKY